MLVKYRDVIYYVLRETSEGYNVVKATKDGKPMRRHTMPIYLKKAEIEVIQ